MASKPLFDQGGPAIPWKLVTWPLLLAAFIPVPLLVLAQEESTARSPAKFLGAASCSSSGCHGGAGALRHQFQSWSQHDVHTRAYATLTTARAARLAESLGIPEPTRAHRCTVCHAPFQDLPAPQLAPGADPQRGVSCESCHGPASPWLRAHARPDYTHAQRVAAGLRDLKNPYTRANTCVACHQTLAPDLERAGHPELMFELDGQCAAEPRHWRATNDPPGPRLWLVGQAVALRETTWQLSQQERPETNLVARWQGLLWLLQKTAPALPERSALIPLPPQPDSTNLHHIHQLTDQLARQLAHHPWPDSLSRALLRQLASAPPEFQRPDVPPLVLARRAERLVLALDRLQLSATTHHLDRADSPELDALFHLAQSLPDFDAQAFARQLARFAETLR